MTERQEEQGKYFVQVWRGPDPHKRGKKPPDVDSEVWTQGDVVHRLNGPAWLNYDPMTGVVVKEQWFSEGQLHRIDGPALIHRSAKSGKVTEAHWYLNGEEIGRPKRGPPLQSFAQDVSVRPPRMEESDDGYRVRIWRELGSRRKDGSRPLLDREYWSQGMTGTHRLNGPADITYDVATGTVVKEAWIRVSRPLRYHGPAIIFRNAETGHVFRSFWWFSGMDLLKEKQRPSPKMPTLSSAGAEPR